MVRKKAMSHLAYQVIFPLSSFIFVQEKSTKFCEIMGKAEIMIWFELAGILNFLTLTYLTLNLLEDCTASLQRSLPKVIKCVSFASLSIYLLEWFVVYYF